jgi:iron complex outermembrane receptor protein
VPAPTGASACRGTGTTNITFNGDASVRGVELELRGLIMEGWTAQLTASYVDAHYDDASIPCNDYNADGIPDTAGAPAIQPGRYISVCTTDQALSTQPKWAASLSTEYRFDLGGRDAFVRALATYRGERESLSDEQTFPSSFKVDAFAGVEVADGLELSVFARNLFDEQNTILGVTELNDNLFGSPTGYTSVEYDPRREFGVQLRYDF